MASSKLEFCEQFLFLNGKPICFSDRPYLRAIYAADRGNLVVRASRQVEKSTFVANSIIFEACRDPSARILFVAPRFEQGRSFSHERLLPTLQDSPCIRRHLLGRGHRLRITEMQFSNGARVNIRPAFNSADACRGLSATRLFIDEVADIAAGDLPVLQETLSHSADPRTILTGTPKLIDNHLESAFNASTANLWSMNCDQGCGPVTIEERSLGATGLICPRCQGTVHATEGSWVPRNPHATWGQGFSISHPMVPWLRFDGILERQQTYDPIRFRNEVLGLPTTLGEHVVTRAELEDCCGTQRMQQLDDCADLRGGVPLYGGIDWGGGASARTVLVIGSLQPDGVFEVRQITALPAHEDPHRVVDEMARLCNGFGVCAIAADGNGNGYVYNRMLFPRVHSRFGLYGIFYSSADLAPTADGVLTRWTVNRSRSIGALFSRVKQKRLRFPCRQDVDRFLDEFACETALYNDLQRSIQYAHPPTQPDDALHATVYALLIATRAQFAAEQYA
jgi:hypothetical protein